MQTLGTAGHVDHGKSTLVRALTGLDPDRLKEEKERGMTIDLGFAWLVLPSGRHVSIVDVPGHQDFIRNTLAGVTGIDVALLVVAADDGVMPQTREHVAILDLLGVSQGVVALTKTDLVDDPEWLDLVESDVVDLLQVTALAGARVVRVSARTGQGLDELLEAIEDVLRRAPGRRDVAKPRLPIDRVFTVPGFGTVVTGTLADGALRVGEDLELYPGGQHVKVRGLQVHKQTVTTAEPGSRVAVNLSGVDGDALWRGVTLAAPSTLEPSGLVDARVRAVRDLRRPLRHGEAIELFWGTSRVTGRLRLLESAELAPGEEGWAQLRLARPGFFCRGDRFVLRQPALNVTVGGGVVVDPRPRYHPRQRRAVITSLEAMFRGGPDELLMETLRRREPYGVDALVAATGLETRAAREALDRLATQGQVLLLGSDGDDPVAISSDGWKRLVGSLVGTLGDYHRDFPLRSGMPKEELRGKLRLSPAAFREVIVRAAQEGHVVSAGAVVRLAHHEVRFDAQQRARLEALLEAYRASPYAPPSRAEAIALAGQDVFDALVEQRRLVRVAPDLYYLDGAYQEMMEGVVAFIKEHGSVSVAEVRSLFGISRKYILPFLQHLDDLRVTRRVGDDRVLYSSVASQRS